MYKANWNNTKEIYKEMTEIKKKWYYLRNLGPAPCRRFAKLYFQDSYVRLDKIDELQEYHIFLIKPKDEEELRNLNLDIQDWVDHLGGGYQFFLIKEEDENEE